MAGATTIRSARWPNRVCGMGEASSHSPVWAGSEPRASKVALPDEPGGPLGQDRRHVHAGIDQLSAHLDRLVGGDAGRHAEDHEGRYPPDLLPVRP